MGVAINVGGDERGKNPPMDPPFLSLGGLLVQSHQWGLKYPELALRRKDAVAAGSRYDWSGNGRHLASLGAATMNNYGFIASTDPSAPTTADSVNVLAPGGELTVVAFVRSFSTSKPVNVVRSQDASPYAIQLSLFGATPRLEARQADGAPAVVSFSAAAMNGFCMMVGAWSATKRGVWFKSPAGALVGVEETSAAAFGSTAPLEFGIEASGSSNDGENTFTAAAIYDAYLTPAQLAEIQAAYQLFVSRIAAPFTA
ncbi:MAG: hypothetical protein DI566_13565 [Microbacterium sp.]|nr:MAG: hypothetical protein DI566_13565 [Microbacterium sp.]